MKKYLIMTLTALVLALMPARAAIYIVGSGPFGNWNPANGVEMTHEGNGIYTLTMHINGTEWLSLPTNLQATGTTSMRTTVTVPTAMAARM